MKNGLNPRQVLEVMHLSNTGALLSIKRHNSIDVVRAFADGATSYRVPNVQRKVSAEDDT